MTIQDQQTGDARERIISKLPSLGRSRPSVVKPAKQTLMQEVEVPRIPSAIVERVAVSTSQLWERDDRGNRLGIAEAARAGYGWPPIVIDVAGDDSKLERPEAFLDALSEGLGGRPTAGRPAGSE